MSREVTSVANSSFPQASVAASVTTDPQHRNEATATIIEDSNNNTSLIDREQTNDGASTDASNSQLSPAIREIHKNSWLKRMPCVDRWSGRFPKAQRPENFWVVFCVHDDKEAFLEFYENRRSAYSHMPLTNVSLSKCLHISPTIVAQENDHEFVITLETQVIRLAASTNEQMLEWMDTMRTKLRELGILEVCPKCKPLKQYIRLFDVTERTALHRHKTGRFCKKCKSELNDTIVHFGEKGTLLWPINWKAAVKAASKAEVILCLGTSLKVLRRYQSLWATDKPHEKRPKLYIVNLQWTPKDGQSTLKIHGKCDDVMEKVISFLGVTVPKYEKENDPIFRMALPLHLNELSTTTRQVLSKESNISPSPELKMPLTISSIKHESDMDVTVNQDEDFVDQKDMLLKETSNTAENVTHLQTDSVERNSDDESTENINRTMNTTSGWYGKGCAKLRKKRKINTSCKRIKKEYVE